MNMGKKSLDEWGREKAKNRYAEGGPVGRTMAEMLALPKDHPTFDESKDTATHHNWPSESQMALTSAQQREQSAYRPKATKR